MSFEQELANGMASSCFYWVDSPSSVTLKMISQHFSISGKSVNR
ncbi:hypothetical protein PL9214430276 [Planktothrix tepida PCC 9214]|uniref:Uncharacterized protein n=1 Tax=Planktothrix tepida PCC 9214 TaxID=671072 RepID=A0A1J1LIF7_9CYAN|nr:hypothetical protein PL9214430276 [Planktothrix tepida PCC 9214]